MALAIFLNNFTQCVESVKDFNYLLTQSIRNAAPKIRLNYDF